MTISLGPVDLGQQTQGGTSGRESLRRIERLPSISSSYARTAASARRLTRRSRGMKTGQLVNETENVADLGRAKRSIRDCWECLKVLTGSEDIVLAPVLKGMRDTRWSWS